MTEILKPTKENIEKSANLILNDEIVAIPTETVYGLGANGLSDIAVSKIFKAKNRPQDNPLILHISDYDMMENLVYELNDDIKEFLNYFWPGPLTVVMKKKDIIPDAVSCGLDTVAIRMPNNEIARSFIKQCGVPIAAPSANISGKPSPTTAEDVFTDMNGKISVILDGGLCNIGIESTVLDLTKKPYTILRPGFYTKEDFLKYEDEILIDDAIVTENTIPKSPGQKYKHYAPKAKVVVISAKDRKKSSIEIEKIIKENKDLKKIADGVNQEGVFTTLVEDKKKGEEITKYYLTYLKKLSKKGIHIYLTEYIVEDNKDDGLEDKIADYCEKRGWDYYISENLELD
mgnify:CR=1 FL=1